MRFSKSRFPIRIIIFDELELIIFLSQGLTLSTASLVFHQIKDILQISEPEDNRKVYDEKAAKNCPSYLIWSIFTRKRELQKVQSLEKKPNNSEGKTLKL